MAVKGTIDLQSVHSYYVQMYVANSCFLLHTLACLTTLQNPYSFFFPFWFALAISRPRLTIARGNLVAGLSAICGGEAAP